MKPTIKADLKFYGMISNRNFNFLLFIIFIRMLNELLIERKFSISKLTRFW